MRSRRRLAPHLEQLETRIVLSRISILPMESAEAPPEETTPAPREAGEVRDSQPEPGTESRADSPPPPTSSNTNDSASPVVQEREPVRNPDASEPNRDDPPTSVSRRPQSTSSADNSEPIETPTEPPTNSTRPRSNNSTTPYSDPDPDPSGSGLNIPQTDGFQQPAPTEPNSNPQGRDFEQPPRIARTPSGDDSTNEDTTNGDTRDGESNTETNRPPQTEADGTETRPAETLGDEEIIETENPNREVFIDTQEPFVDPAPAAKVEPLEVVEALDLVFLMSAQEKSTHTQYAKFHATPATSATMEVDGHATSNQTAVELDGEHVSEELSSNNSLPLVTTEALAVGVLVLNASPMFRRLAGVGGSDEFIAKEADPTVARRKFATEKRRRNRKFPPMESHPLPNPLEDVFAENCLMSLLDCETNSNEESPEKSLAGTVGFWAKLAAIAGTVIAGGKMIYQRLTFRGVGRPSPQAPRYTGPTLWQ